TFVFNTGDDQDTIHDFSFDAYSVHGFFLPGDHISINVDGVSNYEELMATATQDSSSTIFDFGNGDALILANTQLAALDADMFSFF
ncbi:MAG: hypothetical protein AAFW66_16660, partial [Pseudomonadota bacterium]